VGERSAISLSDCPLEVKSSGGRRVGCFRSTHLGFWPSLIQELPAGSAGAFLEAFMPSADKINFVKMIVCPLRSAAKSPVVQ